MAAVALLPSPVLAGRPVVHVLTLKGIINAITARYVIRGVERGEREGAELVVVELDTPGGLVDSMREIVLKFLNTNVPVAVYVCPTGARAASAGTFITLAAHVAAMAPGTSIGAAHPVQISCPGGTCPVDKKMDEKITNFLAAYVRAVAERRGRNVKWAENAVRSSSALTDKEALSRGVVDLIASDLHELLEKIDGRKVKMGRGKVRVLHTKGAIIKRFPMSPGEKFLLTISHPTIAYLLLMIGFYGILHEVISPGAIVPGVVGIICLLLGLSSLAMLPINWAGLALIIIGLAMLIADIWVPSHGVLTIGGAASLALGSMMLVNEKVVGIGIAKPVIFTAVLLFAGFVFFVIGAAVRVQRRRFFSGREALVGAVGEASTDLNPRGVVFIDGTGTYWTAESVEGPIKAGEPVEVVGCQGLRLKVRRRAQEGSTA